MMASAADRLPAAMPATETALRIRWKLGMASYIAAGIGLVVMAVWAKFDPSMFWPLMIYCAAVVVGAFIHEYIDKHRPPFKPRPMSVQLAELAEQRRLTKASEANRIEPPQPQGTQRH